MRWMGTGKGMEMEMAGRPGWLFSLSLSLSPHGHIREWVPGYLGLSGYLPQDRVGHCNCTHGQSKQGLGNETNMSLCLNRPIASCRASPLRYGGAGGVCQS